MYDHAFRPVPKTGVIYVMSEASQRGFRYGAPGWVNLGQGAPETGALPGADPRLTSVGLSLDLHEYAPVDGVPALRDAVAKLYNARYRRGMASQYSAENVCISGGGRTGLTRIAASLGNIHLGHILPDYTAYEELLDLFRAFVPIPIVLGAEEGYQLSAERLRSEIVGMGLGGVLLSNPCNPTGHVIHSGMLAEWIRVSRELSCALLFDEFYAHYTYGDTPCPTSAAACVEDVDSDPVLIVDGLTKNWRYPGWRVSWTVGPKDIIRRLASAGSFLDGGPAHPMQTAAIPLLDPGVADREAAAIRTAFSAKRDLMVTRLREMGMRLDHPPQGAFYCFPALDGLPEPLRDGMRFFEAALAHQVICVPGEFFDVNPGKRRSHLPSRLKHHIRLSFGPDIQAVRTGLDRLEAMIQSARSSG